MLRTSFPRFVFAFVATAVLFTQSVGAQQKIEVAEIETDHGTVVLQFWDDVAPETVKNFKKLAGEEFYDGTAFHRIIDGFMVQGGDPKTKDESLKAEWGTGGPGYTIDAEFNDRKHERGVISMARSRDPNSAGSQFFICLDTVPHLDGQYTAFGKVIKGDDVLEKLAKVEVQGSASGERSSPVERIGIKKIKIVEREFTEEELDDK